MAPKLTKNSAAVKLLVSKLRSGAITESHTPAEVWKSENVFEQYKLPTFRTCFHRVKKQVLQERSGEMETDPNDELNRRCTVKVEGSKKRRLIDEEAEESDDDDGSETGSVGVEFASDLHSFKPLYLISTWEEEHTRTRRISAAIVLPSGVGPGTFSIRVLDTGNALELTVRWPQVLVSMRMLHKHWLQSSDPKERIESYHPKISGFEKALRSHRQLAMDSVESVARIPLPFIVETHIAGKRNLAYMDSTVKVVYVDLKAAMEGYAVAKDCDEFIVL